MKVMLPVLIDKKGEIQIAQGFHNTKNICIYDCTEDEYECIPTNNIKNNIGDFSIQLKLNGIDSIISYTMPPLALRLFTTNGLNVFKAEGTSIEENITHFQNSKLNQFAIEETNNPGSCGSSCNSCSSTCN